MHGPRLIGRAAGSLDANPAMTETLPVASLAERARRARQPTRPVVDPNITLPSYAERWLREIAVTIKRRRRRSYALSLRRHILPALGPTKVRMLQKGRIKSFLLERLRQGKVRTITDGAVTKQVRLPLAREQDRGAEARLVEVPRVGVLHGSGDVTRREPRPEGPAEDAEGGEAAAPLLPALPAAHVREPDAPAGRVAGLRRATARARLDPSHHRPAPAARAEAAALA